MKWLLFIVLISIIGCSSNDEEPSTIIDPLAGLPNAGEIKFNSPAIGQCNYLVSFEARFEDDNFLIEYRQDTLILAITGLKDGNWILKEFLSKGSVSKKSNSGYWTSFADSIFVSEVNVSSDSIVISRMSNMPFNSFILLGNRRSFQTSLVPETENFNPNCWPANGYSTNRWMEYSNDYIQLGKSYSHVNITFDYRDMSTDGPGFMFAYSPEKTFIRLLWVSPWDWEFKGWDLLP
jgi:hypothetical protein